MRILTILFCFSFILGCQNTDNNFNTPTIEPGIDLQFYTSMPFEGLERTYYVHLPENYTAQQHYPLVFVMHGGGILGYEGVAAQSQFSELADTENFIVVYPEGYKVAGFRTWNAGECCPAATLLNTNDVGFINALLNKLKTELPVNPKRVYATGFSNGAQLAYKLANNFPEKYAAIGTVAGVLQDFPYNPSSATPVIHFHSYQDTTAPYFGGLSDAPNINLTFPSVEDTLLTIANAYNCDVIMDTVFSNLDTYSHFRYYNCNDTAEIQLYVSQNGGHSWPGGQALPSVPITNYFNASQLMWDFFSNYELP